MISGNTGRLLLLAAVVVCAFGAFAGCSKKQSATTPQEETSASAPSPAPAPPAAVDGSKEAVWSDLSGKRKSVTSYIMVMDTGGHEMRTALKMKDGQVVRLKANAGDKGWALTQFDKKVQYAYDPTTRTAMKMPLTEGMDAQADLDQKLPDLKDLKTVSPKFTSEKVDGVACWRVDVEGGSAWVDKEYGLPRQYKAEGKTTKVKYEKINAVPDSEFELPAGTKVKDMADMMKNMPMPKPPN